MQREFNEYKEFKGSRRFKTFMIFRRIILGIFRLVF
jgi:hypothetical protein